MKATSPATRARFRALEDALGKKAIRNLMPMQPGDVPVTYADTTALQRDLGYKPATPLEDGLRAFAKWYREYYKVEAE